MDTIFTLNDNDDDTTNINLDELYERKQQHDLNTINTYNKILQRIHSRVKVVSRQNISGQFCWYVIPEVIIGIPKYDHGACTAYIIDKLRDNGFNIRYTHPNLLFISWQHWIPSYVRHEIKKKTGVVIDGYGNKINKNNNSTSNNNYEENDPNQLLIQAKNNVKLQPPETNKFKDIDTYTPSGNLIYNQDLFKKIEAKSKV